MGVDALTESLTQHGFVPVDVMEAYRTQLQAGQPAGSLAHWLLREGHIAPGALQEAARASSARHDAPTSIAPSGLLETLAAPTPGRQAVALSPGDVLGKYRIVREVGRGGMGVVYEAVDSGLGRSVALKTLVWSDGPDEALLRFHREGALAARMSHPGIVAVYDVDVAVGDGRLVHYIAMELALGTDLADAMAMLDIPTRLQLFTEVVDAVEHAHALGVIHRDLKPANVLLTAAGHVKVTDFGLARSLDDELKLTQEGAALGTAHYMAPEQVEGRRRDIGKPTDVWALGVMLYELLTDRMPFDGAVPAEVFRRILAGRPAPPRSLATPGSKLRPSVLRDLEVVCLHALEVDPARRYADAGALAADLRRLRAEQPISARPASAFYHLRQGLRRRRTGLAVVAFVALLGAAVGLTILDAALTRSARNSIFRQVHVQAQDHLRAMVEPAHNTLLRLATEARRGVHDLDRSRFRSGDPDAALREPDLLTVAVADILELWKSFSWVSYSSAQGDFTGAYREPSDPRIRISRSWVDGAGGGRLELLAAGGQLTLNPAPPERPAGYDPRLRPFYERAVAAPGITWTEPYPFWNGFPGITAALAVRDARGTVTGVFTVDFDFHLLQAALTRITLRAQGRETVFSGRIWVLSEGGSIVADSHRELLRDYEQVVGTGSTARLPRLVDLDDSLVTAMRGALVAQGAELSEVELLTFSQQGQDYELSVRPCPIADVQLHAAIVVSCTELLAERPHYFQLRAALWSAWILAAATLLLLGWWTIAATRASSQRG